MRSVTVLIVMIVASVQAARIERGVQIVTPKTTPHPPPTRPHCEGDGCVEFHGPDPPGTEYGACCISQTCVGSEVPEARCQGRWAGAGSTCDDCSCLISCCNELTGQCSQQFCSDCYHSGGVAVEICEQCQQKTTPAPPPTPPTRPPHPTPPTRPPHPTPPGGTTTTTTTLHPPMPTTKPGPPDGACCLPDGTCTVGTQIECHRQHGAFRGDYTECSDTDTNQNGKADICERQCCVGTLTCLLVSGKDECDLEGGVLGTRFTTECPNDPDTCGVSCCVNEQCLVANSVAECEQCQGRPFADKECSDIDCGGACCTGSSCRFTQDRTACIDHPPPGFQSTYKPGESCNTPGICGGACCSGSTVCIEPGDATICQSGGGVYQGDDTSCGDGNEPTMGERRKRQAAPVAICLDDGACCVHGECVVAANARECFGHGGVWQGSGTSCLDDNVQCSAAACCFGRGCTLEPTRRACEDKGGRWNVPGTTCAMPAVCDASGGACCCKDKCISAADEDDCDALHGTWLGIGSSCREPDACADPGDEAGACCTPRSYFHDGSLCSIEVSRDACEQKGGVFQGAASTCGDQLDGTYQCKVVRGACCVATDAKCYDALTIEECRDCGGHFAGEATSCDDEYVCDPRHTGACCKAGWPCKQLTHVKCLRDGGRFQGWETQCDDDAAVCAICLPGEVARPNVDDCATDDDCPVGSHCLPQYGLCAVFARRIPSQRHAPDDLLGVNVPLSMGADTNGDWPVDNLGPLSCGDEHTLGLPCVAHPHPEKCAIGVCTAPPVGSMLSEQCVSICRELREYPCNCEPGDAWLKSCASIEGSIFADDNNNGQNDYPEGGVAGATVRLSKKSSADGTFRFFAEQVTPSSGRYSFQGIPAGIYKVSVELPAGLTIGGDGEATRRVTVECLEDLDGDGALRRKRASGKQLTQITVQHKLKAAHLAEDVDFFAVPDTHSGTPTPTPQPTTGGGEASSDGGLSGGAIAAIVLGSLACCVLIAFILFLVLRGGDDDRRRRAPRAAGLSMRRSSAAAASGKSRRQRLAL